MKKIFIYIVFLASTICYAHNPMDLIYSPYSEYTQKNLQNITFKKYNDSIWTYLFIDRHLRINLKLNPLAWFSSDESKIDDDGIPIDYFNFRISWNF